MREMVEYMVKQIVDNPAEVKVQEKKAERIIFLEISVAKEDMEKVMGKGGRIAAALRTLVEAAAVKRKRKVMLEILEEQALRMEQKK